MVRWWSVCATDLSGPSRTVARQSFPGVNAIAGERRLFNIIRGRRLVPLKFGPPLDASATGDDRGVAVGTVTGCSLFVSFRTSAAIGWNKQGEGALHHLFS
jgi:hypothetical protein